jgi:hypothetical protein
LKERERARGLLVDQRHAVPMHGEGCAKEVRSVFARGAVRRVLGEQPSAEVACRVP